MIVQTKHQIAKNGFLFLYFIHSVIPFIVVDVIVVGEMEEWIATPHEWYLAVAKSTAKCEINA